MRQAENGSVCCGFDNLLILVFQRKTASVNMASDEFVGQRLKNTCCQTTGTCNTRGIPSQFRF